MAKKRLKNLSQPRQMLPKEPKELLEVAVRSLRQGNNDRALQSANEALRLASSPEMKAAAQAVSAEIYFRAAMQSPNINTRLSNLETALKLTPLDPRLSFYRALVLWRLGRHKEAGVDLEKVAAKEPNRPGLAYLRELLKIQQGDQAVDVPGLDPGEVDTLTMVQSLSQERSAKGSSRSKKQPAPTGVWSALAQMRSDEDAAPVEVLRAEAAHIEHVGTAAILDYYTGVAAMRRHDQESAQHAWQQAQHKGMSTDWLQSNIIALLRERAIEFAKLEQWQAIVDLVQTMPPPTEDAILSETVMVAYFHLGYQAALAGNWATAANFWRQGSTDWGATRHLVQNLALAEEAVGDFEDAADAWREMVKRRPRKQDHPDYLDDSQVAAIWAHTAECYIRADETEEAVTCLKNAVKYTPDDIDVRIKLAQALTVNEQYEAAQNELQRVLDKDPDHVEALVQLGALQMTTPYQASQSIPIWERVLRINPQHVEARDALAIAYLQKIQYGFYDSPQIAIKMLEDGLKLLPDHPMLLSTLGIFYREIGQPDKSREVLGRTLEVALKDLRTVSLALHELLHVDGGDQVEGFLPTLREFSGLLPPFWLDQGERVLNCELDTEWAKRFFDEAVALVEQPHVQQSKASVLMDIYSMIPAESHQDLLTYYAHRIRQEVPKSGAEEFIKAVDAATGNNKSEARRWLKKAKKLAQGNRDSEAIALVEEFENELDGVPKLSLGLLQSLMNMFPDGPPDLAELEDLPDEFFDDFF